MTNPRRFTLDGMRAAPATVYAAAVAERTVEVVDADGKVHFRLTVYSAIDLADDGHPCE